MNKPSEILGRVIALDAKADRPLHMQLRRSLRTVIDKYFQDGDRFFSESELISHLQVSPGTVRRALADLANEGLIERRVAKGSFVRKKPQETTARSVGVFLPAFESEFWARLLEQFSRLCRQLGYGMSVYHTERGEKLADAFKCLKYPPTQERILLMGGQDSAEQLLPVLEDRGYRAVVLDTPIGEQPFVGVDNRKGIALGMEHLVSLGHRRIALLVNQPADHPNVRARVEMYCDLMRASAQSPIIIDCKCELWGDSFEAASKAMEQVAALSPRPTALFAVSDEGAWAAMRWCMDHGISVPEDLSVMGFDDDRPSRFTHPALTTISQPVEAIAEAAMRMLWDDAAESHHQLLAPSLVVRASTALPKGPGAATGSGDRARHVS